MRIMQQSSHPLTMCATRYPELFQLISAITWQYVADVQHILRILTGAHTSLNDTILVSHWHTSSSFSTNMRTTVNTCFTFATCKSILFC